MNSAPKDVLDRLVTVNGYTKGGSADWGLFLTIIPDSGDVSDNAIGVLDTPPNRRDGFQLRSRYPMKTDGVQLMARGVGRETPRTQLETITDLIIAWGAFYVGTVRYQGIFPQEEPFFLQQDGKKRYVWLVNFHSVRQQQ